MCKWCYHPEGPRSTNWVNATGGYTKGVLPHRPLFGGCPTLAHRPCRNSAVQDRNNGIPTTNTYNNNPLTHITITIPQTN